jgi:hypothetical protein
MGPGWRPRPVDFVYAHAEELGGMRAGNGPRPRLLFQVAAPEQRPEANGR